MHHVTIDDWSRRHSYFHERDARAKFITLLVLLAALSTSGMRALLVAGVFFGLLLLTAKGAGLPIFAVLARSALVLPFCAIFAIASALAGDSGGAIRLIARSYVSGLAGLLFIATTPLPALLRGLEQLRAPRFLLTVMQFLYRYLFVLSEEAQHVRMAALSRGGLHGKAGFRAAAGALSVLFARSHARAAQIHCAMLSRGYDGRLPVSRLRRVDLNDFLLVSGALLLAVVLDVGLAR